ncbi:uncharacterized protein At5g01610-like [Nicotiana tomentosiformis]|uniref:uncharacterized protein At5g01610-like n=1 Tax=Nicotiana tomentosiformis TaxID=4098 RepID=UPI00051B43AE|nr:uncharacterized protein LOC104121596 [Nicotiana tomentosiformis]
MPMSLTSILCFFFLFFSATTASRNEKPSAYEELQRYDFPMGILPKGVKDYKLNTKTGEFSAYLNSTCSFRLETSYQLNYKPVIKGVISKGRLTKLSGVSVKVVLLWLNIVEVRRKGGNLEFSVGLTSANFPIENFEECPQCGCGLDCVSKEERKIRQKVFVSSS